MLAKYNELMSMSRKERADSGEGQFPQEPIRKRFLISDVTPEGLGLIHAQNKRCLCLWANEVSAWFKNFNRYNSGSEEQSWLSVFSAKTTISDRKNAKSSIFIKRLYMNDKELPEDIKQEWNAIIDKLVQQEYAFNEFGEIEPHILLFMEDARDGFTNGGITSQSCATERQTT